MNYFNNFFKKKLSTKEKLAKIISEVTIRNNRNNFANFSPSGISSFETLFHHEHHLLSPLIEWAKARFDKAQANCKIKSKLRMPHSR